MANSILTKLLFIAGLITISCEVAAGAIANATVSVNVVPSTSFFVSDSIVLNARNDGAGKKHYALDSSHVVMTSLNASKPARFNIKSYENRIYDITISASSTLANDSNSLEINNMKVINNAESQENNGVQEFIIEGVMLKPDHENMGTLFGTTEININYN